MIYLTLGDGFSGVYLSQVINVCKHLSAKQGEPVPLVAFISLRVYRQQRRKIKQAYSHAWVLPAWPGTKNWRKNYWLMRFWVALYQPNGIMARGILATQLALQLREKEAIDRVIFDGRGAYHAEWREYDVVQDQKLVEQAFELEQESVIKSDLRLAVSEALVTYWRENFNYQAGQPEVIVPCTLGEAFLTAFPSQEKIQDLRQSYGFNSEDLVLVYAGSIAGWQSFQLVDALLAQALGVDSRIKVLFLAKVDLETLEAYRKFPDRVAKDWVSPQKVFQVMCSADLGLLVREASVTNRVAAPTKFAEYLAAGLEVLISPEIGDYSELVIKQKWGHVIDMEQGWKLTRLRRPSWKEKRDRHEQAIKIFSKDNYQDAWERILATATDKKPSN